MSNWIIISLIIFFVCIVIATTMLFLVTKPSLSRNWSPDQAIMPSVEFLNEHQQVKITNIRDIHYRTTRDYDLRYYDKTINLDDVDSAWLAIAPFAPFGIAHTFVSFGMKDGSYLAISIEVRRQKGKSFHPVKAFLRQFEMMYVLAEESDIIKVRTNIINYTVRLFPIQTEQHKIQAVFIDMLQRTDKLGKEPEFYNTLWNNCTTNIIKHTKRFSNKPLPFWDLRYLFPDTLDKIAYKLNMIDTHLSYKDAREHFDISELAKAADDAEDFSKEIRKDIVRRPIEKS